MKKTVSLLLILVLIIGGCRQAKNKQIETVFIQQRDWIGDYNFSGTWSLENNGHGETMAGFEISVAKDTCTVFCISPQFYFYFSCTAVATTDKLHLFYLRNLRSLHNYYNQQDTLITLIRKGDSYYVRSPTIGKEGKYNVEIQAEKGSRMLPNPAIPDSEYWFINFH